MSLVDLDLKDGKTLFAASLNTNFGNVLAINIYNEDLTPLTNGTDVTFLTALAFKPGTLRVYLSGSRIRPITGTTNFVEDTDINGNGKGFTMSTAPTSGAELIVDYQRANV